MEEINFKRRMSTEEKEVRKLMKLDKEGHKETKKKVKRINAFVSPENQYIGEMVLPKKGKAYFLIYHHTSRHFSNPDNFELGERLYKPAVGDSIVIGNILKIPRLFIKYGKMIDLKKDLREFVLKYVDIQKDLDLEVIITYIMLTWVYDRFTALPYLRIVGDYGTGKSRLLKVLNVCYNSLYTSGLASAAPIFRLIHQYSCTLLIDEMELSGKAERNEDIKEILRFGKDAGGVIMRCDQNNAQYVNGFKVFGPKVLSSRRPLNDDALESRVITVRMVRNRPGTVKLHLDRNEFEKDSEIIRAKLLCYRLKNYFNIDTNAYSAYINEQVSPRLNEMIAPLICVRETDKDFVNALLNSVLEKEEQMKEDKSLSFEATILRELYMLHIDGKCDPLLKDLTENVNTELNKNYASRFIGSFIRESFKLKTRDTRNSVVVVYEKDKILGLLEEYNISEITKIEELSCYDAIKNGIGKVSKKPRNKIHKGDSC